MFKGFVCCNQLQLVLLNNNLSKINIMEDEDCVGGCCGIISAIWCTLLLVGAVVYIVHQF